MQPRRAVLITVRLEPGWSQVAAQRRLAGRLPELGAAAGAALAGCLPAAAGLPPKRKAREKRNDERVQIKIPPKTGCLKVVLL